MRLPEEPEDQAAAHFAELWNNKMFLEPAVHGYFPEELVSVLEKMESFGKQKRGDEELFAENTVDFLGVNFYHPNRVKRPDISQTQLETGFQVVTMTITTCLVAE